MPDSQGLWSKSRVAQVNAAPKGGPSGSQELETSDGQVPQGLPWPLAGLLPRSLDCQSR